MKGLNFNNFAGKVKGALRAACPVDLDKKDAAKKAAAKKHKKAKAPGCECKGSCK